MRFVLSLIKVLKMSRLFRQDQDQDQDHFSCPWGTSRPRPRSRDYISGSCSNRCLRKYCNITLHVSISTHQLHHSKQLMWKSIVHVTLFNKFATNWISDYYFWSSFVKHNSENCYYNSWATFQHNLIALNIPFTTFYQPPKLRQTNFSGGKNAL